MSGRIPGARDRFAPLLGVSAGHWGILHDAVLLFPAPLTCRDGLVPVLVRWFYGSAATAVVHSLGGFFFLLNSS